MKEHEKLKRICDEIGYKYGKDLLYEPKRGVFMIRRLIGYYDGNPFCLAKSIEIIFTPEFMEKYYISLGKTNYPKMVLENYNERAYLTFFRNELMLNLNDPVTYLYNLLFNK